MAALKPLEAIPQNLALQLCNEISADNRGKWYTFRGLWCWGCVKFSKTPEQRCYANADNTGCAQVNKLYAARYAPWRKGR
jgi:hypothetical protein